MLIFTRFIKAIQIEMLLTRKGIRMNVRRQQMEIKCYQHINVYLSHTFSAFINIVQAVAAAFVKLLVAFRSEGERVANSLTIHCIP